MMCGYTDHPSFYQITYVLVLLFQSKNVLMSMVNLAEHLDKASTAYSMEISAEKTKLMTNNTSSNNTEIKVNGQKL